MNIYVVCGLSTLKRPRIDVYEVVKETPKRYYTLKTWFRKNYNIVRTLDDAFMLINNRRAELRDFYREEVERLKEPLDVRLLGEYGTTTYTLKYGSYKCKD